MQFSFQIKALCRWTGTSVFSHHFILKNTPFIFPHKETPAISCHLSDINFLILTNRCGSRFFIVVKVNYISNPCERHHSSFTKGLRSWLIGHSGVWNSVNRKALSPSHKDIRQHNYMINSLTGVFSTFCCRRPSFCAPSAVLSSLPTRGCGDAWNAAQMSHLRSLTNHIFAWSVRALEE